MEDELTLSAEDIASLLSIEDDEPETEGDGALKEEGKTEEKAKEQASKPSGAERRIQTVRDKEREEVARLAGYASYAELTAARENNILKKHNIAEDDEAVKKAVEELVEARLKDDPRLKDVEQLKKERAVEHFKSQYNDLKETAGWTRMEQIPTDVVKMYEKLGNLKQAYYAVKGDEILTRKPQPTTNHLGTEAQGSAPIPTSERPLTDQERKMWKDSYAAVGRRITDEELDAKRIKL